ncbi:hypothetical protein PTKIN_Ptkin11bG0179800 [Pterospermum kingtungense]
MSKKYYLQRARNDGLIASQPPPPPPVVRRPRKYLAVHDSAGLPPPLRWRPLLGRLILILGTRTVLFLQRGVDVLLNDEPERETPSVVCFGEKQRFLAFCYDAPQNYCISIEKFDLTRAYLDAATIASLKPLTLMHDCAAATALGYGIYKTDFSSAGPTYVAFVGIGHCDNKMRLVCWEPARRMFPRGCLSMHSLLDPFLASDEENLLAFPNVSSQKLAPNGLVAEPVASVDADHTRTIDIYVNNWHINGS